jgi:4-amino-4-deoxy-L-arabinose transferase-like glycosyltransferase
VSRGGETLDSARFERLPVLLAMLAAAGALALFLVTSLLRLGYPFELEWMEGTVLAHVQRVVEGQPLYVAPTLAFVPLDYTPLYYYVSAGASLLFGQSFTALRLVSSVATWLSIAAVHRLVRFETGRRSAGWVSAGCFAALYWRSGTWFDVARPDMLALALGLIGAYAIRRHPTSAAGPAVAGALLALSILAKQSMAVAIAPLVLWICVTAPRRGAFLAACMLVTLGAVTAWFAAQSDGWFRYYVVDVALAHHASPEFTWRFPAKDIGLRLFPMVAVLVWAVANPDTRPPSGMLGFHAALLLGFIGSSWHMRMHIGSFTNVSIPAFAALSAAVGVAWGHLRAVSTRKRSSAIVAIILALQIAILCRNPVPYLPTKDDRAAGERLVSRLRSLPGRLYVSSHSYLARRAGRAGNADVVPLMDVLEGHQGAVERRLLAMLRDTLASHSFDAAVLDDRDWLGDEFRRAGYETRFLLEMNDAFWPVTGRRTRPEQILVPRRTP